MRDMLDTLTRGPFRDDTHRAAVEAAQTERAWLEANIAQCRQMLANCGDDDIITKMSFAGLIEKWKDRLDKVPAMPIAEPAEPVGGVSSGLATQTHAGASEAAQHASEGDWRRHSFMPPDYILFSQRQKLSPEDLATERVARNYAAARSLAAEAGPLPLATTEPWAESDQAYSARLAEYLGYDVTYSGSMLDDYGVEAAELPRARLVPATTMQGEP